jgi:hypothetical protein
MKESDYRHSRPLRVRGERPRSHRSAEKRDELAPSHLFPLRPRATAYHMLNESCVVLDRGMIEIEFATGARMRITGAVDANALTAAVAVLAEGRRR